jgi:hypothetical protein
MTAEQKLRIRLLNTRRYLAHQPYCPAAGDRPGAAACCCGLRELFERIQLEQAERIMQR